MGVPTPKPKLWVFALHFRFPAHGIANIVIARVGKHVAPSDLLGAAADGAARHWLGGATHVAAGGQRLLGGDGAVAEGGRVLLPEGQERLHGPPEGHPHGAPRAAAVDVGGEDAWRGAPCPAPADNSPRDS